MSEAILVYTTWPDAETAGAAAAGAVEARLAACVNMMAPVASVYRWEGEIERAVETPVIFKTTPETVERLLTPERLERARTLGQAMRLGCDLSGRSPPLLAAAALTLEKGAAILTAARSNADLLLGEQTAKRLANLAGPLGLEPKVRTT